MTETPAWRYKRSTNPVWNHRRGQPLDIDRIMAAKTHAQRQIADYIDSIYYNEPMLGIGYQGKKHLSWYAWMGKIVSEMSHNEALSHLNKLRAAGKLP